MPDGPEDDIDWGTKVSSVSKRRELPSSSSLGAFRATLPELGRMKLGDEVFVPTMGKREDFVISTSLRKLNARHSDRRWFGLQEWRHHIRGRLIVCVSPRVAPQWEALWEEMIQALRVNKCPPPLDASGNAFVPRLPLT